MKEAKITSLWYIFTRDAGLKISKLSQA